MGAAQRGLASRRRFLALAAGAAAGVAGISTRSVAARGRVFVGCRSTVDGRHRVSGFDERGASCFDVPLPDRGHAPGMHPSRPHAVVLARRPGTFAVVVDLESGQVCQRFDARAGRHFYGHAVYSHDGNWLYTTENDFEAGRGVVVVRDASAGYRQVGEFPSGGVGPHAIRFLGDRRTLLVANGGIRTHPHSGRAKLNLDTMRSSLAFLDSVDGRLIDEAVVVGADHRLSIRHLDVADDGGIVVAMQHQGPRDDPATLVALHERGALRALNAGAGFAYRARNYAGSVAFDRSGEYVAATHPRGGFFSVWSVRERRLVHTGVLADVCGIVPAGRPGAFLVTGGGGSIARHDALTAVTTRLAHDAAWRWDNHVA